MAFDEIKKHKRAATDRDDPSRRRTRAQAMFAKVFASGGASNGVFSEEDKGNAAALIQDRFTVRQFFEYLSGLYATGAMATRFFDGSRTQFQRDCATTAACFGNSLGHERPPAKIY
jgi:hypothetical protein